MVGGGDWAQSSGGRDEDGIKLGIEKKKKKTRGTRVARTSVALVDALGREKVPRRGSGWSGRVGGAGSLLVFPWKSLLL